MGPYARLFPFARLAAWEPPLLTFLDKLLMTARRMRRLPRWCERFVD